MASTGHLIVQTGDSLMTVAPYSNNNWSSAANITANDGVVASVTATSFDTGDYTYNLRGYNSLTGTEIPDMAQIDGIEIIIRARCTAGSCIVKLAAITSAEYNLADDAAVPSSWTSLTYGGPTSLFGLNPSAETLKYGPLVLFAVQATADDTDIEVDYISVNIYYTEIGGNSLAINDASTWYNPTPHINVGGTWIESDSVHVNNGGTWKQVYPGLSPIIQLPDPFFLSAIDTSSTYLSWVGFYITPQGEIWKVETNNDTGASYTKWDDVILIGYPPNYEVRLSAATGTNPNGGTGYLGAAPPLGTYQQLTFPQGWSWELSGIGTQSFTGILDIRDYATNTVWVSRDIEISLTNGI